MAGAGPVKHDWPRDERALSRNERLQFQKDLEALGFDPGTQDGVLGRKTRAALRQYQKTKSIAADGFPTQSGMLMLLAWSKVAQTRPTGIIDGDRRWL